jgi:uncharacterized protein (DUF302 family)
MDQTSIYTTTTDKPLPIFIDDLDRIMQRQGFIIHNRDTVDMAATFSRHDLEVEPGFDLHMIQICKPGKAAFSLGKNPRRAALMPKFITVFSEEGKTVVQFLMHGRNEVSRLLVDQGFPDSLAETYRTIITLIEAAC